MNSCDSLRCSDVRVEPLPGSAKQESVYVLYEHAHGWSHDVLDGGTFGPDLTAQLKEKLGKKAGLQLVKRSGRAGRNEHKPHLFIVHAAQASCEMLRVDSPHAILDLDLETPGANGGVMITHPLILVCTHGKRDVCCAVKGRPLAGALTDAALAIGDEEVVWETSHTKGHRFAPSILLMPWGYSFGRLNEPAARSLLIDAHQAHYFLPGNRGRGLYGPRGQVAELAVAKTLLDAHEPLHFGDLHADDAVVTHVDGRRWMVELEGRTVDGVLASCGKIPGPAQIWGATEVKLVSRMSSARRCTSDA